MYDPHADESPFNALPPVVVVLALIMGVNELVLQAGDRGMFGVPPRIIFFEDYAFRPAVWEFMITRGQFPLEHLMRFITFPFIHGSFTHAAFAIVIVLAIGKAVGEIFSSVAFLAVFFLSSVFGAVVYGTLVSVNAPLIGGYPGAYGLIGAFTFLLWVNLAAVGANSMRAFSLIGVLLGIQLVFGILFGAGLDWIADIAAFVAGFGLSFVLSPGGWSRVLEKLRRD
ncbi:rhomboid family intramembrane serine protease [uncultured Litoreibacter sp.]|uniref:rhomboid family intramembrane serine protease n=1 Tax=uncultured Litoreibacter sp. TaxID=1392394 RepID=UPI0026334F0F|nr:rhomboid family intramembrane serine protease [uncultured Litoreibacter sp.]